jgi:putative ABC transport system permease protein
MNGLLHDLGRALRAWRDQPLFAVTTIAVLAVGIAASTAVFSVVNAVVLKPVPFAEPDTLLQLAKTQDGLVTNDHDVAPANFAVWQGLDDVFEDVAAYTDASVSYANADVPEQVAAQQVSEGYFRVFGVPLAAGRTFARDDDRPGAPPTVVLGYDFWQRRLGGDPAVIGTTISLAGNAHTVLGVTSAGFDLRELKPVDLWLPLALDRNSSEQGNYLRVAARLRDGVSLEQARARLAATLGAYRERFPDTTPEGQAFVALPIGEAIVGPGIRDSLWVLFGAVAFVLLIACANVANLLLIRSIGRRRDVAIRLALGAARLHLMRRLLAEGLLLAAVGGTLGLALGFVGIRALLAVNTADLPRIGDAGSLVGLDWRVAAFTTLLVVATTMLFALVPALVAPPDLNSVMKDAGGRGGAGRRQNRALSALVVLEIALAVVLLVGAMLLIRTSLALSRVDPGFSASNVLTLKTALVAADTASTASVDRLVRRSLDAVRAMPGVTAAAASCCVPLERSPNLPFNVVGRPVEGEPFTGSAEWVASTEGYFETFEVPLLRGRILADRDGANAPPVAVINRAFAERYWPNGADPIGERIAIGGGLIQAFAAEPERQIVGVVADTRAEGLGEPPLPMVYVPLAQLPDALVPLLVGNTPLAWVVRTAGEPGELAAAIQGQLRTATGAPVTDVRTMLDIVRAASSRERFNMLVMSVFGGAALLLATVGIYGLVRYSAEQRTHELGIRAALGATPTRIGGMVMLHGGALIAIGTVLGLVVAFGLANFLAALLFGVEPHDALAFFSVPATLAATALAAVFGVARRAGRTDPMTALRSE